MTGSLAWLTGACPLLCGVLVPFEFCCWRYLSWFELIRSKASMLCCLIFSITTEGGRLIVSNTDPDEVVDVTEFLFCCWSGVSGKGRFCGPIMRFRDPVIRSRRDKAGLGGHTGRLSGSSGNWKGEEVGILFDSKYFIQNLIVQLLTVYCGTVAEKLGGYCKSYPKYCWFVKAVLYSLISAICNTLGGGFLGFDLIRLNRIWGSNNGCSSSIPDKGWPRGSFHFACSCVVAALAASALLWAAREDEHFGPQWKETGAEVVQLLNSSLNAQFKVNAHLSRMILSLRVPVEHVITGRTKQLSIAFLALDGRGRRSAEFAFLQGLGFELNWLEG